MTAVARRHITRRGCNRGETAHRAGKQSQKLRLFETRQSTSIQAIAANDAAISVLMNATAVVESTRNSDPALKPRQPNQSARAERDTAEYYAARGRRTLRR